MVTTDALSRAVCKVSAFSRNDMLELVLSSPPACHGDLDSPSQQQARISASCATRELDELMASLSDFKVKSRRSKHWQSVMNPQLQARRSVISL